ncbi:ras-related protein Rab-5B-like isoform X2 [Dreissena polymorpha]|uniref:Uncharacterized protein n=1 Tax=Dreissena polymorpha TaxID=45954 RepID=A0A9D4KRE2_DREPO|nr:ras-related protein Rab-5B-like isoform X2 [Dreissena polymorpha]KAH3844390.1 hypothetical protein DPMN_086648 [Dreissena polymorpha]
MACFYVESTVPTKVYTVRIVMLGACSGKSAIAVRFVSDRFEEKSFKTVGAVYRCKKMEIDDDLVCFQVWDTSGNAKYTEISKMYLRGAHVAMLVYDVTKPSTFEELKRWVDIVEKDDRVHTTVLVGNMQDLPSVVDDEVALALAQSHGMHFTTVSAKTGQNVHALFLTIATLTLSKMKTDQRYLVPVSSKFNNIINP